MRSGTLRLAVLAAALACEAQAQVGRTGFDRFKALCIDPDAKPGAVAAAAKAQGFAADPGNPLRFVLGEEESAVVLVTNVSEKQTSPLWHDFDVAGCTVTVRKGATADLDGLWAWMGFEGGGTPSYLTLPWTAYVMLSSPIEFRQVNGKMVPMGPHEVAGNQPDMQLEAFRSNKLRLMHAELTASGGVKMFYGVVRPWKKG